MSAPLSSQQPYPEQVTGMFGGPRGRIRTRGAYSFAGVGDPLMGYNGYGYYWRQYPGIVAGMSGYAAMSTATGVPLGTPQEDAFTKGDRAADVGATTDGMSQGGTAAG